jgi:DNA-binding transcriptional LysR family regulator
MDVELARTFLAIVRTGSFVRAAEVLNVSQTTISARVRTLEEQLGRPLFRRSKQGASLTAAGEQMLRFAPMIVQLWQRARQQVAVPKGRRAILSVGGEFSLWHPWLAELMVAMRRSAPEVALRMQVGPSGGLIEQVAAGALDLAVVYAPHPRPGVRAELLLEERLVLVTTDPEGGPIDPESYVYVDWGQDFAQGHDLAFPEGTDPSLVVDHGPLALSYLLKVGGSGYFRQRIAAPLIAQGRLHPVPGSPAFFYPVYAVVSGQAVDAAVEKALADLRAIAAGDPGA